MRRYAVACSRAVASSAKTVGTLVGVTTTRGNLYHLVFGASGTPADNALNWLVQRFSMSAGTATAVTPQALDSSDPAALLGAGSNHTSEPTYSGNPALLSISAHQKATIPWYAREGCEIKLAATAATGVGLTTVHASYTGNVEATFHFWE